MGFFGVRIFDAQYSSQSKDADQSLFDLFLFQYMTSWYYSVLAFALADVCGRSQAQLIFLIVIYIVNIIAYSTIMGVIIDTIYDLQEKSNELEAIIDDATMVVGSHGMGTSMKEDIR